MIWKYENGELTTAPLWPWPYEEIIKEQMGMEVTMTEYVHGMIFSASGPEVSVQGI